MHLEYEKQKLKSQSFNWLALKIKGDVFLFQSVIGVKNYWLCLYYNNLFCPFCELDVIPLKNQNRLLNDWLIKVVQLMLTLL